MGVRHMGFQRHDEAEAVANSGGEMERRAQQADHRDAHRQPARFDAGVEGIALDHCVETLLLGFDGFLHQRRGFQNMMQARERFALFEQSQHRAAAEIFGISQLKSAVRRGVAFEQLGDVDFELGGVTLRRVV